MQDTKSLKFDIHYICPSEDQGSGR